MNICKPTIKIFMQLERSPSSTVFFTVLLLLLNILKIHGTDVCSMGIVESPDDPAYEEVVFIDRAKHYYKKCIIHNDRLVGAILIGDKAEFLEYRDLIQNKIELSEKRLELLRSNKKAEPVLGKLVCSCGGVGEGNIINKINEGCNELKALCAASGAGMGCGSCRPEVQAILERMQPTAPSIPKGELRT